MLSAMAVLLIGIGVARETAAFASERPSLDTATTLSNVNAGVCAVPAVRSLVHNQRFAHDGKPLQIDEMKRDVSQRSTDPKEKNRTRM